MIGINLLPHNVTFVIYTGTTTTIPHGDGGRGLRSYAEMSADTYFESDDENIGIQSDSLGCHHPPWRLRPSRTCSI